MKTVLSIVIAICVLVYGIYFYYIDTLSFSEIMGSSGNDTADIFINLFDFNTGLTRHDMSILAYKSQEWHRRMIEIEAIKDDEMREKEKTKLIAEMMRDSSFKKLAQKLFGKGVDAAKATLDITKSFKSLGLF